MPVSARIFVVAVAVVIAVLALLAGVRAQTPTPTPTPAPCPDADGDNICDTHPTWPVCKCGVRVNCTDNCIAVSNGLQFDPDCDGRGSGNPDSTSSGQMTITLTCDPCPHHYNPLLAGGVRPNRDGDVLDDACDCAPDDPGVPANRACPNPDEDMDMLRVMLIVFGALFIVVLLVVVAIIIVRGARRRRVPGTSMVALASEALFGNDLYGDDD
jgi:hypothetical protein